MPLASLARVVKTVDTSTIRRMDGRRTVTLSVLPPEMVPLERADVTTLAAAQGRS